MKRTLILLTMLLFSSNGIAQNLQVKDIVQITDLNDGQFFHPQMGPGGEKIFFTGANYAGLFYFDLNDRTIKSVTKDPGAGYNPVISMDGKTVYYRTYQYAGMKRYSTLIALDIENGIKTEIESAKRELSFPNKTASGDIHYSLNSKLKKVNQDNYSSTKDMNDFPVVFIENRKIVLYANDKKQTLEPLGPGIYIWPSISPQGDRILFTLAGKGTFISDLEGNIQTELGFANSPKWSPDGNYIVYMNDKDDGHQIIASEIFIIKADGSEKTQLTNTPDRIEMYPSWGKDNKTLVYALDRGEIFLMRLTSK